MKTIIKKYEEIQKMKYQAEKLQDLNGEYDMLIDLAFLEISKKEKEFSELQDIVIDAVWDNLRKYDSDKFFSKNINGEKNYENIKKLVKDGIKGDYDYDYDYERIAKPLDKFLDETKILDKLIIEIKKYEAGNKK